jgi:tight adherence protein B
MEVVMLLMGGLATSACVLVMLPSRMTDDARRALGVARVGRVAPALSRVGSSAPLRALFGLSAWAAAARLLALDAARGGHALNETGARGLLALLSAAVVLACALVSTSVVGVLVGAVLVAVSVPAWVARRTSALRRQTAHEMPDVFRSLATSLSSGQTLAQAVGYVGSHGDGPVRREFARASMALTCGEAAETVLDELAGRIDAPGVGLLAAAMGVSQRTGSPLADLFRRSAHLVELQGEFEQRLLVKTAQVRLSARIVAAMPAVMVGLLLLLSPDFRQGVLSPVGLGSICIAAVLDLVALALIRRLMREVG